MDLVCYNTGAAVPLVFILPFACSAPSLHPPPTPAGFPLTLPTLASLYRWPNSPWGTASLGDCATTSNHANTCHRSTHPPKVDISRASEDQSELQRGLAGAGVSAMSGCFLFSLLHSEAWGGERSLRSL